MSTFAIQFFAVSVIPTRVRTDERLLASMALGLVIVVKKSEIKLKIPIVYQYTENEKTQRVR